MHANMSLIAAIVLAMSSSGLAQPGDPPLNCLTPAEKICNYQLYSCTMVACNYNVNWEQQGDYQVPIITYSNCGQPTEQVPRDMASVQDCTLGDPGIPSHIPDGSESKVCAVKRPCKVACAALNQVAGTYYPIDERGNEDLNNPVYAYVSICQSPAASIDDTAYDVDLELDWIKCKEYSNCENGGGGES